MQLICSALTIFLVILFVRVIFTWIPRPPEPLMPVVNATRVATDWAVLPLRNALPPVRLGGVALDLSILVLFFGVQIIQGLICR